MTSGVAADSRDRCPLRTFWTVLRAEGARSVAARAADRLAEARRRRSFRPAAEPPPGFSCGLLNISSAPPAPRFGGVQAQLLARLAAEAALRPVALLYPEAPQPGAGFRLELQRGDERRALCLPAPPGAAEAAEPRATALTDPLFEKAVTWAAACCGATAIQPEGLAGMPLASLLRLHHGGLRLVLALHDFAAFCPRPHLLEKPDPPAPPRFCHYSTDPVRCARCLARDYPGLPPSYQQDRRDLARQLLAAADAVVHPSPFLARAHRELFGGAGSAAEHVIAPAPPRSAASVSAHPVPPRAADSVSDRPQPPRAAAAVSARLPPPQAPATVPIHASRSPAPPPPPRHVAWVGAVQCHKGALVFEAAVERLAATGRAPRLSAYGGGDPAILRRWRRLPGLRVRGYYRWGSLPDLLRRDRVDLALLLSIVPESYSLTLDECAAAAVPVMAFDLGALGDRLAAGAGLLLPAPLADDPAAGGAAVADVLTDLLDNRRQLPPPLPAAPHHAAATASAWVTLYEQLRLVTFAAS
jgi:glycosyltransferase involved in cell wall biosynthesis